MKKIVVLVAIFSLAGSAPANAAPAEVRDTYIGLQFGNSDVAFNAESDLDLDLTLLQFGIWVSDDISLEGRSARGGNADTIQGVDYEIESIYGLYGLYHFHFGEFASLYASAGMSRAVLKTSVPGVSEQQEESSFSYGVGAKLSVFSIDFMRYMDIDEMEIDVVSVGLQYTFN
ncbi:MAG: porin family protein [Gammaproteobacteria bacterium]|nr:porin family protein [Gammaproteobacteria bacterium]